MTENARRSAAKARAYAAKTDGDMQDQWNKLAAFWDEVAQEREKEDEVRSQAEGGQATKVTPSRL